MGWEATSTHLLGKGWSSCLSQTGGWGSGWGDSPDSLTTTEADPDSSVLGFFEIHVYVPSWAAVIPLMFRWSPPFFRARPLKVHTYSGSGQDRDTHHRVKDALKSTLMVHPVRTVESWRMATRSGPTVGAGGRDAGQ
jgi:hypothetical protein